MTIDAAAAAKIVNNGAYNVEENRDQEDDAEQLKDVMFPPSEFNKGYGNAPDEPSIF
ncbi:MAG: hypothetical protein AAGI66_04340 [Cyanobacteria bacterium P01_H01_bin.74]